jgi:hypothetical protein
MNALEGVLADLVEAYRDCASDIRLSACVYALHSALIYELIGHPEAREN